MARWRGPDGGFDLAGALDGTVVFAREHGLADLERRAQNLRDELDRPLLLAVLGEFNAGKSTLVNAFIGAEVAPMGIVPTTATLNVLRGGAERRVRVVRKDGSTREGAYEELAPLLADAEEADEGAVDHVEIILPSEILERVWILDTPGTNALDPEHERLAREAARRADAALWVFDASQAGKLTESKILDAIRGAGRVVVPVLNKKDRLSVEELATVREVLGAAIAKEEEIVALSARAALRARVKADAEAHEASGFPALMTSLAERVFDRSRELKRGACGGRLLALLDDALAAEGAAMEEHERRLARLGAAAARLAGCVERLREAVDEAVRTLGAEQDRAFEEAAREVLAFVRPRTSQWSRHGVDPEDRAFLVDVLSQHLGAALERCRRRLSARVRGELHQAAASLPQVGARELALRVQLAVAPAVESFGGYQKGLLEGGALRRFFEEVLPKAELEEATIARALGAARADAGGQLRPALEAAIEEVVGELEGVRREAVAEERRAHEGQATRVFAPLRALREVLAEPTS